MFISEGRSKYKIVCFLLPALVVLEVVVVVVVVVLVVEVVVVEVVNPMASPMASPKTSPMAKKIPPKTYFLEDGGLSSEIKETVDSVLLSLAPMNLVMMEVEGQLTQYSDSVSIHYPL